MCLDVVAADVIVVDSVDVFLGAVDSEVIDINVFFN